MPRLSSDRRRFEPSPETKREPFWIRQLTSPERNTLVATFGGWALDGLDVMVYSFVIPSLIAAWHISQGQAGLLAAVVLLISAIGGWLAGLLADRFGRAFLEIIDAFGIGGVASSFLTTASNCCLSTFTSVLPKICFKHRAFNH